MLDFARSKGVLADSGNFVARKSLARNSAQIPELPVPKANFEKRIWRFESRRPSGCSNERRLLNSIALVVRVIATTGCLQLSEQNKDEQDYDHESKSAAAIIAGAIERTAANAAKAPEKGDDQNDQYYGSD